MMSRVGACVLVFLAMISQGMAVWAGTSRVMCVYDPVGANGPVYNQMRDYSAAALDWGVTFDLKPYTEERIAAEDFKAGRCDAVLLTSFKSREFNAFTGSLDAIGALPTYKHLKTVFQTLASPKASRLMVQGDVEIAGLFPAGAAFLFVNNREIDSVPELSGKRIGVLDTDPSQREMAVRVGASPVSSGIARVYSKFNNGVVDVVAGPAVLYESMELNKGLAPQGGIIDFPLAQLSLQLVIRQDRFEETFGQNSRVFGFQEFDRMLGILRASEDKIPTKWWIEIPSEDKTGYIEMMRQARLSLRDKAIYNAKTLTLMRKVRCRLEPGRAECTAVDKE